MSNLITVTVVLLSEKNSCDSGLFSLVNSESMESCPECSETGFISEQLCMKTFAVVAGAEV